MKCLIKILTHVKEWQIQIVIKKKQRKKTKANMANIDPDVSITLNEYENEWTERHIYL